VSSICEVASTTAESLRHSFDATFAAPVALANAAFTDVLAIQVGADPYALRLSEVAGLYADRKLVEVPGPIDELLGVAGIRGLLVPVYDLAAFLGYPRAYAHRWFVLARAAQPVGLAFSAFDGHLRLTDTALAESDLVAQGGRPGVLARHVCGSVQAPGLLRPLIDIAAVLATIETRTRAAVNAT
jgi:purine-binding chemotaxis protein CheW